MMTVRYLSLGKKYCIYKHGLMKNDEYDIEAMPHCVICLEPAPIRASSIFQANDCKCDYMVHVECVETWLSSKHGRKNCMQCGSKVSIRNEYSFLEPEPTVERGHNSQNWYAAGVYICLCILIGTLVFEWARAIPSRD